jgi:hypothetical protein
VTSDDTRGPQPQQSERVQGARLSEFEGGSPKGEPWLVQVDVYLDSVDPLAFHLESCLPQEIRNFGGKDEKYLVFNNNCRPGFKILFELHDLTNDDPNVKGYRFPHRADDAVWSQRGAECPREYCKDKVLEPVRVVEPDGATLVVEFKNEKVNEKPLGDFRYTLNVIKDGAQPLQLDPGGTGNNGQSLWQ